MLYIKMNIMQSQSTQDECEENGSNPETVEEEEV